MNKASDEQIENLDHQAAFKKISELAKSAKTCLFGTSPGEFPLTVRPMAVQEVDEEGNLWFLSGRSSIKNAHIAEDPRVQLFFSDVRDSEYLSVQGMAEISDDRYLREKYWTSLAKTWFHDGVDDPELTVIKVQPTGGYYWDTEHGKAVTLLKMAVDAVTGKTANIGVSGKIRP